MQRPVSVPVALLAALLAAPAAGQGIPKPSPSAEACAYLPLAELEQHFGTKPRLVQGIDVPTRHTCNATFPDPVHAASVESHPSSGADLAMTAAQRLNIVKAAMEDGETKDFGHIGCFKTTVDMGEPVPEIGCFLAKAPYLLVSVRSPDSAQVTYEATRRFLELAAAKRK